MTQTLKAGRVTVDDQGVRSKKFIGLFGAAFSLPWDSITGWAFGADVIKSRANPKGQVVQWVIELDDASTTHVLRLVPDTDVSKAIVRVFEQRLPAAFQSVSTQSVASQSSRLDPSGISKEFADNSNTHSVSFGAITTRQGGTLRRDASTTPDFPMK